jgi:hypothetical protein
VTAGALVVLFWAVIALLGAMCGFAFIGGLGRVLLLVLAVFFSFSPGDAAAQAVASDTAFDRFMQKATGAGKTSVEFARDGTPVASAGVPSAAPDGGSGIKVNQTGNLRNPSGNPVPVAATGRVSNAAAAAAIGRFLGRALPVASAAAAGYELLKELNIVRNQAGDEVTFDQTSINWYGYVSICGRGSTTINKTYGTPSQLAAACTAAFVDGTTRPGLAVTCTAPGNYVVGQVSAIDCGGPEIFVRPTIYPEGSKTDVRRLNEQGLIDAIASKSGWPTTSAIARAAVEAANGLREPLSVSSPTVSGPASTPGPAPTVKQEPNADGSTKTTTTSVVHNHNYQGNTVTTTNVTTINITNNGAAGVNKVDTVTETPPAEAASVDTPLPAQPKLYERKFPNGLVGVWTTRKAELSASPLLSLASTLMPSIAPTGTCPVWMLDLNFAGTPWQFGAYDVAPACDLWKVAAAIVIVSALLLARALVFGG